MTGQKTGANKTRFTAVYFFNTTYILRFHSWFLDSTLRSRPYAQGESWPISNPANKRPTPKTHPEKQPLHFPGLTTRVERLSPSQPRLPTMRAGRLARQISPGKPRKNDPRKHLSRSTSYTYTKKKLFEKCRYTRTMNVFRKLARKLDVELGWKKSDKWSKRTPPPKKK